jgi:hypothetical protein
MKISSEELLLRMKNYYDGCTFDREAQTKLYNPFSTLRFFKEKSFSNFWMQTGKPKVIADYMKHRNLTVEEFRNFPISNDLAQNPGDMDTTTPHGFLHQCGYLTLREGTTNDLSLDYPNTEVLNSMSVLLSQNIVTEKAYNYYQNILLAAIISKNAEDCIEVINSLLSCIPYVDFTNAAKQKVKLTGNKITVQEWLYRSCIISFLRGCGVVTFAEVQSNIGRSDIILTHKGNIWVIEIKVAFDGQNPDKKAKEAIKQIKDNNYAKPYPGAICLGVAIDDTKRQITDWRIMN